MAEMKQKVYLETTIVSYLTAWPSRDLVTAAHQQITREWWEKRRTDFDLFISQIVVYEAGKGDPDAAARRSDVLKDIPHLGPPESVDELAQFFVDQLQLPSKAVVDGSHLAFAVGNGMDYLLTWNCAHLANAVQKSLFEKLCRSKGFEPPTICTPEQLMEK